MVKKGDSGLTAYILLMAMGVHSFFAGTGLGVQEKASQTTSILIAVLAHKWSEALTVGISFVTAQIPNSKAVGYMIFFSFITPLGILLGIVL